MYLKSNEYTFEEKKSLHFWSILKKSISRFFFFSSPPVTSTFAFSHLFNLIWNHWRKTKWGEFCKVLTFCETSATLCCSQAAGMCELCGREKDVSVKHANFACLFVVDSLFMCPCTLALHLWAMHVVGCERKHEVEPHVAGIDLAARCMQNE